MTIEKTKSFRDFARSAPELALQLADLTSGEDQLRIAQAVAAGARLSACLTVGAAGDSEIVLELLAGDNRQRLVTVPGRRASVN